MLEYAVRIIRVAESMKRSAAGMHIADQLLRFASFGLQIRIFARSIQTATKHGREGELER